MDHMEEIPFVCPITELLTVLSAKWTVEILRELCIAPTRTRRFLAHVPGLTMKCLRQRLQRLEEQGFVHREEFDVRPRKVEYSLTENGRKLVELFEVIKRYADDMKPPTCICPIDTSTSTGCTVFSCPSRRQLVRHR